jgi:hypothetical protein
METKKRLADQADQKKRLEGGSKESEMSTADMQGDLEETSVHCPPKKRGRAREREGGAEGRCHNET